MSDYPTHPAYPFRLDPVDGIAQSDQGSLKEITGTGASILLTPLGHHDSVPDLGLPDGAFRYPSPEAVEDAVRDAAGPYDPRVLALPVAEFDDLTLTVQTVLDRV